MNSLMTSAFVSSSYGGSGAKMRKMSAKAQATSSRTSLFLCSSSQSSPRQDDMWKVSGACSRSRRVRQLISTGAEHGKSNRIKREKSTARRQLYTPDFAFSISSSSSPYSSSVSVTTCRQAAASNSMSVGGSAEERRRGGRAAP